MSNPIASYQLRYMSYGSWLSEWLYGIAIHLADLQLEKIDQYLAQHPEAS